MKRYTKLELSVYALVVLQAVVLAFFLFFVFAFQFYLNPAVEFLNTPLPVDKEVYEHGDPIRAFVEVCRYTSIPSLSFTELHDNSFSPSYVRPLGTQQRPGGEIGCYNIWTTAAIIPLDFPTTNNATLHGKAVIEINAYITRVASWETVPFVIQ